MLYSDANKFDNFFNIFMFYVILNFIQSLAIMYVGGPVNSTIRELFSFSSTFALNWKSESRLSEAKCRSYPFHCYFPNPNFFYVVFSVSISCSHFFGVLSYYLLILFSLYIFCSLFSCPFMLRGGTQSH